MPDDQNQPQGPQQKAIQAKQNAAGEGLSDNALSAQPGGNGGDGGLYPAPLQRRTCFLKNWNWAFVSDLNKGLCERGNAAFGTNPQSEQLAKEKWEQAQLEELTLLELLHLLREFHRSAPFLNFNGNTFVTIGNAVAPGEFLNTPQAKSKYALSSIAHYITGTLSWKEAEEIIIGCFEPDTAFKVGDLIETQKGSLRGTITKIEVDGGICITYENGLKAKASANSIKHAKK